MEPDGIKYVMAPIIQPNLATAAKCAVPVCESCLLGRANKSTPGVAKKGCTREEGHSRS